MIKTKSKIFPECLEVVEKECKKNSGGSCKKLKKMLFSYVRWSWSKPKEDPYIVNTKKVFEENRKALKETNFLEIARDCESGTTIMNSVRQTPEARMGTFVIRCNFTNDYCTPVSCKSPELKLKEE